LNKISTTAEPESERPQSRLRHESGWSANQSDERLVVGPHRRYGVLSHLRSYFVFDPLIWAYTLILGTVSLICSFFDRNGRIQHNLARFWSQLIMKTILSPVTVTGNTSALAPPSATNPKPRVFAVNHASALDIPILYADLPFQFRIVFKSELLAYPFVGWHLKRSGQVCINQQHPTTSVGAIKSALRSLRAGMPLVIFPEGGRTSDGSIQPFLPGAFFLAIKAQADIVPVTLIDTFNLLPMNTYHIRSQPLEMRVGEPISTVGLKLADTDAVSARVKAAIEALRSAPRTT
jgi:1-acyl-sn-glycerol-3-phosphate acyltransferase